MTPRRFGAPATVGFWPCGGCRFQPRGGCGTFTLNHREGSQLAPSNPLFSALCADFRREEDRRSEVAAGRWPRLALAIVEQWPAFASGHPRGRSEAKEPRSGLSRRESRPTGDCSALEVTPAEAGADSGSLCSFSNRKESRTMQVKPALASCYRKPRVDETDDRRRGVRQFFGNGVGLTP